jgi:hypothetical protein
MKRLFININLRLFVACLMVTTTLLSCSKWDDYKKYTNNGEIIYTGKLDSAKIFSGKDRIRLTGQFNADPKIVALKVFWNNKTDSAVFDVKGHVSGAAFDDTVNVTEGIRTYTIVTYDADGNKSIPVNVTGVSYGSAYRRKLSNRVISGLTFTATNTVINWEAMDLTTGAQYTEVEYSVNGETKKVTTPASQASTVLDGLIVTTPIKYRTIFKPDVTCIDTFAVAYTDRLIKIVPQLKNRQVPFIAAARSGRWGNLADWKSNDAVKNHGGYGGWDEWNSNIFNVESGWGSPAITNGKIWQTMALEPGTYTFEISDLRDTNLTEQDNAYLVVAQGSELPNVENVTSALGYVKVVNGKPLSALRVTFTIAQTTEVSMGYLTSQPDGWPGRYCNIRAFNFYEN